MNHYCGAAVGEGGGALNHAIIIMPNDNREWGKWLIMIMMMETVDSVLSVSVCTLMCVKTHFQKICMHSFNWA